eukprot:CAMPEP_0113719774 /NCGR_PEP_ID=MMETSP0038_2-20120614/36046_1 /TAXON_ID=2898 /ORGANISM="Cryptomonas paramecium" /LENGTH=125 /DNA_ID=CAMNT_0000648273 /DNA_START=39 /DNA_END=412 /DNA_ORIENTATION=+ /assembly_acc=CAM_ASM_000170
MKRVRFADEQSSAGRNRTPSLANVDLSDNEKRALLAAQMANEARLVARSMSKVSNQRAGSSNSGPAIPRPTLSIDFKDSERGPIDISRDLSSPKRDEDTNFLLESMSWISDIFSLNQLGIGEDQG